MERPFGAVPSIYRVINLLYPEKIHSRPKESVSFARRKIHIYPSAHISTGQIRVSHGQKGFDPNANLGRDVCDPKNREQRQLHIRLHSRSGFGTEICIVG